MILLEVMLGILVAGLIARYNESNKLFWILFTSFVLGIAGQTVYEIATESHDSDSKNITQVIPTQSSESICAFINAVTTEETKSPQPTLTSVVKENTELSNILAISKSYVETRKRPPRTCNPIRTCTVISTRLDT